MAGGKGAEMRPKRFSQAEPHALPLGVPGRRGGVAVRLRTVGRGVATCGGGGRWFLSPLLLVIRIRARTAHTARLSPACAF